MFFFEKKNQRTFGLWRMRPGDRTRQRIKVFCFFSSEKKTFLLAGAVSAAGLCPALAEAPFDFDHTPGKLPKSVVPQLYTIDIVPDLKALTLAGHETIAVDVRQASTVMTVNQAGLTLAKATLEDGSQAAISQDERAQTATLRFDHAVPAGAHVLTIDYTGPIPNSPAGLYYDDYKTPSGAAKRMLVTQFEVADARRMFPGWDEPAFKARFKLSAVLPSHFAAVSNMPIVATVPAGAGLNRVQFATTPRMSTYLLALIAGEMSAVRDTVRKTGIAVWAPTGEQDQGRYALSVERNVLPYYSSYFGFDYPLPKLDMIAIPGNYEAGAMENWGAITYIDDALLFDDRNSAAYTREGIHVDVAHEMAHQWSGDLVTMAWWDNIWLNEGFATWMEFKATDHFNPSWQVWPRQHEAREEAMAQDALPTTHPIQQPIRDESEANAAFDDISYQKGEQIIRMVEDWIGPDVFRAGMRAYMKAHAYSNATSADLWAALSAASSKNVAAVAAGFTEQPGIPLVHVTRRCVKGKATLTLSEDRFAIHDPKAKKLIWTIPVSLGAAAGPVTHSLLGAAPVTLPIESCGAVQKANLGEDGYYRVQYDAASLQPLVAHFAEFGPADRANLLGDEFALFLAGREPLSAYLDMLPALKGETNIAVWDDTLDHLSELDRLMRGSPARAAFRAFARALVQPEFARLGWDAKPGESFLDALLRPRLIGALGEFDDPEVTAEARRRFDAFLAHPASLAANLREPVLLIVGHHADQATYDTLRRLGVQAPGTEEKLRFFSAMAAAQDPKLIAQTMQFAASGAIPNGRIPMVINTAAMMSDNPDAVWQDVQPVQADIRKHLTEDGQSFLLPAAAASSGSAVVARALVSDPASHASIGAKIAAARVADAINTRAQLQQRAAPAMAAWLKARGNG
jgi:aminopeptidase N